MLSPACLFREHRQPFRSSAGNAEVTLSWSVVPGATSYNIYHAQSELGLEDATAVSHSSTSSPLSYTHSGLTNGSTYYYEVAAVNSAVEGPRSTTQLAIPKPPAPGAPVILSASAGNAKVTLTWSAVPGATSYKIYHAQSSQGLEGATAVSHSSTSSPLSYTHSGLTNGSTYYYEVAAVNSGAVEGPRSNPLSLTFRIPTPSIPSGGYSFPSDPSRVENHISEDLSVGREVGRLPTQSNGLNLRYSLQTETPQRLTIDAQGVLRVGSAGLDYEANNAHTHQVTVTINYGSDTTSSTTVTVYLRNVNEPPIVPAGGIDRTLPRDLFMSNSPPAVLFRSCEKPIYPANTAHWRKFKSDRVMLELFEHISDPEGGTLSYEIISGNPTHSAAHPPDLNGNTPSGMLERKGFCIDEQGYLRALYASLIIQDSKFWSGLSPGIGSQQLDSFAGGFTGRRSEAINLRVRVSDPQGLSRDTEIRFAANTRATAKYNSCEALPATNDRERRKRWRCHNLPERLQHPLPTTNAADRNTLPNGLMQPKANYRLVMRDEFNGDALDTNLWSWGYNGNLPTLRNGKLSFLFFPELRVKAGTGSRPASSAEIANEGITKRCAYYSKVINSTINFQYGYMEFDITGNLPIPGTFSTIISYPTGPGIAATPEYALTTPLDENLDEDGNARGGPTLQDVLSLVGAEIDIMEQYSSWSFG